MEQNTTEFKAEHGYWRDREVRLREVGGQFNDSLAIEAANQIKHLKSKVSDLECWVTEISNHDQIPDWIKQSAKSLLCNK